jgi:hypothetical protein
VSHPKKKHREEEQTTKSASADRGHEEAVRTIGHGRSSHWETVEKAFRKLHPQCTCCVVASTAHVQIHHCFPFHYCVALGRPDLELDMRNLITLCEWPSHRSPDHHLLIGHLGFFQSSNLTVVEDAHVFRGMSEAEIKKDSRWLKKVKERLVPLDEMTVKDKADFKKRMNRTFPKK